MSKLIIAGFDTSPIVRGWSGSTAYLQIFYCNSTGQAFSFSTGEVWQPSPDRFYREIACPLADNVVTPASFELDTTTDIVGPAGAQLMMRIVNAARSDEDAILLAQGWQVPTSLQGLTSVTYEMLRQHNTPAARHIPDTSQLSRSQVELMIGQAVNVGNPMTTAWLGRGYVDTAPADPAQPILVGTNSPLLPSAGQRAALAGTSGTPSNSNRYVTNSDPHVSPLSPSPAGTYERATVTVDAYGRVTSAAEGFSGGSVRVVYASAMGAALDSNLDTGGGTDDTAIIQSLLDLAQTAPVHVVIDGPALTGQLRVYSNTTLEGIHGGGLYLKSGTNKSLLVNAHPSAGAVTDRNITVRGLTMNGNSVNQTGTGLFSTQEPNGNLIGLVQLFGVNNLRLEHLHLIHSKTIACWVGNAVNVYVNDLYLDNNVPGQFQQGGLQLDGPASRISVSNIRGTTQDDLFALNTDDCAWVNGVFTGLGPYVACGPITDVTATNVVGIDAYSGVRFFNSTNRIDRVRVSNISGTFHMHVFNNDPLTIGPGNVGTFVVDGINAAPTAAPFAGAAVINIFGRAEQLIFRDVNISGLLDTRPVVNVAAGAEVDYLEVSGLGVYEATSASVGMIPVTVAGKVRRLVGNNWKWGRDLFLTYAEAFLKLTSAASQVEKLVLNGSLTNRANRIVYAPSGRLGAASLTNVRQGDCLGGITVDAANLIGDLNISNWHGEYAIPFSGTAIKKRGDAFPADTTAPTFSSAVATGGAPFVVVAFSEPVNGSNLAAGVVVKKNTVTQTISSAKRRDYDPTTVEYVLSANVAGGDTVTWEYAAGSGNAVDLQNNPLANVAAQAVTVSRTGYVYDLFTAVDGTAMNGRAPSPLTAGNNWATLIGTAGLQTIRGNRLRLDASAATQSIVVNSTRANVIVYGSFLATSLPNNAAGFGIIFRATDANNYWLYWLTDTQTTLFKVAAGVATVAASAAHPHYIGIPYLIQIGANGNSISCNVNGAETLGVTDSFNATATKHGFHAAGAVMAADDFTVVSFS